MKKFNRVITIIVFLVSIGISWFSNTVQAEETTVSQTLIEKNSDWKYYYNSSEQYPGDNWLQPDYDSTAWQTGQAPIGYSSKATIQITIDYGADKNNKYPVAFFRKNFDAKIDAANKDAFNTLVLDHKIDDSAVIYINGQEVKRINYPASVKPDFTTYSNILGNDGNEFEQTRVDLSSVTLKETGNVVAVAVFQQSASSSDLVFDLSLSLQNLQSTAPVVDQTPAKISMTFHGDARTSKSFTWHTASTAGSQIRYIASTSKPQDFSTATIVDGVETYAEELPDFVHKVVLTNLQAGTTYWYQVGDSKSNQWSEPAQFTTASVSASPFHFLFFDDTQGSTAHDYEVVAKTFRKGIATAPNASFIIQGGDLVNNSNKNGQWQDLFGKQQDVWSNNTIMAVSGNHDAYNNTFLNHFNYNAPSSGVQSHGVYYSYDYQQAHYVMLNTNDIVDGQMNTTQVEWLTNDIKQAKANGAKWVIVTMHKGTQTVANHISDKDVVGMRKQLQPLFDQLGVDLVLQGHDHTYARTNQMGGEIPYENTVFQDINGVKTAIAPKGTVYLTSNSSGTKFYSMKPDDIISQYGVYPAIKGQDFKQMFTDIAIDGNNLVLKSYVYDAEGTGEVSLYDSYAIQKQDPAVKSYQVTFESNGGSAVQAQTVEESKLAVLPKDPTKKGYTFKGWYTDAGLTTPYDFSTPVTKDITLFAKWDKVVVASQTNNNGSKPNNNQRDDGQKTLPKTGEMQSFLPTLGLILLVSLVSLIFMSKKKSVDDVDA